MKKILITAVTVLALTLGLFAQKDTDNGTISTSGGNVVLYDAQGSSIVTFEYIITGAPATVNIVTNACMRGGTCSVLDTNTTVANVVKSFTGGYDYYSVVATWTGGTSPTVKVNKTGLRARAATTPLILAASDSFVRANGALGSNWLTYPGSDCTPTISTNKVMASSGSCTHSIAYYKGRFSNNQFSVVTLGTLTVTPLSASTVAIHSTSSHTYNDIWSSGWRVGIINGAVPTDIFSAGATVNPVAGNLAEIDVAGTNPIFFWGRINGTINSAGVDGTYLFTGGAPGVGVIEQNTVPTATSGAWNGGSLPDFNVTGTDNFVRSDSGWLGVDWWFPWHDDEGTGWKLVSNKAVVAAIGTSLWSLAVRTTPLAADHTSSITYGGLTASDWLGVIARYTPTMLNASDNFYMAVDNNGTLTLFARSAGAWNSLATAAYTAAPGDVLAMTATGINPVSITVKVNGVTKITFSDAVFHVAGNYAGFAALVSVGTTTSVSSWTGS